MDTILDTIINSSRELIGDAVKFLPNFLIGLVIIFLTRYVAEFMRKLATRLGKKAVRSVSLQLLLTKTASIGTWILGIVIACVVVFPGLRLGDLIATLGLGSVAIGFAFQDIFKNFLSGILILIQEPFSIGDQIIVSGYEGTVESIEIRTTNIRTYQGELVLIPNSVVFTNEVQVRTAYGKRRTDLGVGVDYNTSLPQASKILNRVIKNVNGVLDDPEPEIDLVSFGDSSIDFVVRYWTSAYQKEVRHVQTRAIVAIKKAFDQADINIPYPIRTLYFYNQDQYNDYLSLEPSNPNNDSYR